jgi:hypothetical protein
MGVEYIVSERLFNTLPETEKALWHSHVHEVKSGQLIAPGIPEVAEHELMEEIANTYGKTWHTWHTDQRQELPLGTPMLMMGFTRDGQVNEQMVQERDQRFDVSSADKRARRPHSAATVHHTQRNTSQIDSPKAPAISRLSAVMPNDGRNASHVACAMAGSG